MTYEEAVEISLEALKKQIPEKTIEDGYNGGACVCPDCGWVFAFHKEIKAEIIKKDLYHYCPNCGQAILWE